MTIFVINLAKPFVYLANCWVFKFFRLFKSAFAKYMTKIAKYMTTILKDEKKGFDK